MVHRPAGNTGQPGKGKYKMRDRSAVKYITGPMLYTTNEKYFTAGDDAFLKRSILVTATTVGDSCRYSAKGELPEDKRQKEVVIEAMVKKIFSDLQTDGTGVFSFFLDAKPIAVIQKKGVTAKFDHPSNTASWVLHITEGEFRTLQQAWRKSGLPIDLFKSFCQNVAGSKLLVS
jgi:hypothetical protein